MATDADSIVDVVTGESIQDAASSTISLAGKIQEEEEGELHKWGYFVQKRNLDSDPPTSPPLGGTSESLSPTTLSTGSSDLSPTNLDIPILRQCRPNFYQRYQPEMNLEKQLSRLRESIQLMI